MKITIDNLELAQFTPADTRALYAIRNHGSVRAFMANAVPIPYEKHEAWVKEHLIDGRGLLLFLVRLRGEEAIGFTLLQRHGQDTAEIGVLFQEASQHPVVPYVSTVAMLHLAFCHLNLAWVVSYLMPTHERALSLNRSFGPTEVESDKPGQIKLRLSHADCLANPNYLKVFNRMKAKLTIRGDTAGHW